jgi:hypothetical protein
LIFTKRLLRFVLVLLPNLLAAALLVAFRRCELFRSRALDCNTMIVLFGADIENLEDFKNMLLLEGDRKV